MMCRLVAITLFLMMSVAPAWALDDTQLNRFLQAERYVKLFNFEAMLTDAAATNAPPDQRASMVQRIRKLDMDKLRAVFIASMTEIYTADELAACADFYSTPMGRRIMSKLGKFNLAIAPGISEETQKAFGKP
jgi:hypothetical protein